MKSMTPLFLCAFAALGLSSTRTVSETTSQGETTFTDFSSHQEEIAIEVTPLPDPPEIIWHYSLPTGMTQKIAPLGQNSQHVFTGGWYGGGVMYAGTGGDGSALWTVEPEVGANEYWTFLGTGTTAAATDDIYYAVQKWNVYNDNGTPSDPSDDFLVSSDNTSVSLFNSSSSTPLWTYTGGPGSFISASADDPGKSACASDGSVLAVAGAIDGHLAVQFFNSSSSTPVATYEDPALAYYPRQLRITADGSRCIFRVSATLYRVDTATGTLEASFSLDASNDCFAISPDGSVVAYGFTAARIATWDGSAYNLVAGQAVSGYYGGAAAIAADNSTIYFGFYKNNYKTNRILRFDVSSSVPLWTYDYPTGSGSNQDVVEWMDCSDDGRWMVAGSWGCNNGGDEIEVFDDENPTAPVFTINTPGSVFHVDMSPDGRYVTATGKHVHANTMGSGTDTYFAEIDVMGIEEPEHPASLQLISVTPNPVTNLLNLNFSVPSSGLVSIQVLDLSGRMVQNLVETHMSAGLHSMSFSTDLGTGMYFCTVSSNEQTATGKLIVVR